MPRSVGARRPRPAAPIRSGRIHEERHNTGQRQRPMLRNQQPGMAAETAIRARIATASDFQNFGRGQGALGRQVSAWTGFALDSRRTAGRQSPAGTGRRRDFCRAFRPRTSSRSMPTTLSSFATTIRQQIQNLRKCSASWMSNRVRSRSRPNSSRSRRTMSVPSG